jgi:hypothetical protein
MVNDHWWMVNISCTDIDHSPLSIKVPNAQVSDTTGDATTIKSPVHKNHFSLQRKNKLIEEDKSRRCKLFKHEATVVGH